jgi:hypothetical protein
MAGPAARPTEAWERDESAVAWVYGSILAGAAVVVAAGVIASAPGQVLVYTLSTMIVVWLVHSYAAFVGHGGRFDLAGLHVRLGHAMRIELPILAAAAPTLVALGATSLMGAGVATTGIAGLVTSIATMAVVATRAAWRAGAGRLGMAAAAGGALVFGAILIAAKVALK